MTVLVTGITGQLGHDLMLVFQQAGYQVVGVSRKEMDLCNQEDILRKVNEVRPKFILHAAAETNVDGCESNPDRAYTINALATRTIAVAAAEINATLIYFSTDYVFDGSKGKPYQEWDNPSPINVYGHSKWVGEEMVKRFAGKYFIIRTSWVFGQNGKNFIKTILGLAKDKDRLQIVNDQIGSPTFSWDLALFTKRLVETNKYGIYHCTNSGACSWLDLARFALDQRGFTKVILDPVDTKTLGRPAQRPLISVLDNYAARLEGFSPMPAWEDAVNRFLKH